MEIVNNEALRIQVGDMTLWTAPFGDHLATITATDQGMKDVLMSLHDRLPNVIQIFVDDEDFCEEDMAGAFSVIVDPKDVYLQIDLGQWKLSFVVNTADQYMLFEKEEPDE